MSLLKKTWTAMTWAIGGYSIYNQLKTLDQAKNELFNQLAPEQQAEWIKVFGAPQAVNIQTPSLPPVILRSPVSDLEKLKAGV